MTSEQVYGQVRFWVKTGRLSFEQLESLQALAYEKEQRDDARTNDEGNI